MTVRDQQVSLKPRRYGLQTTNILKYTAMHFAVDSTASIVSMLLDFGFDLNREFNEGQHPLLLALHTHQRLTCVMIPYCSNNDILYQVLAEASWSGHLEVVKAVLSHVPLDVNATILIRSTMRRTTCLHNAVIYGHVSVVKYLLGMGAKPTVNCYPYRLVRSLLSSSFVAERKKLPKHKNYCYILDAILESAPSRKQLDYVCPETGSTAFFISCSSGHICMALRLMQAGADVHRANSSAISPLHFLVQDTIRPYNTQRKTMNRILLMLVLYIVNFQPEYPWLPKLLHMETFTHLDPCIQHAITHRLSNPATLTELSRAALYRALSANVHLKISQLGLPSSLEMFLQLHDIMFSQLDAFGKGDAILNKMDCCCNPYNFLTRVRDTVIT